MKTLVVAMALVLLNLSSASAQFVVPGEFAAPPDAELGYTQYPIYPKALTEPQMARLEVKPRRLNAPTVVFNHYRRLNGKDGRFVLETLPVGTVVLVDKNNVLRYKADCGNRIVEFKKTVEAATVAEFYDESSPGFFRVPEQKPEDQGFWAWIGNGLYRVITTLMKGVDFFFDDFGWLLLFLTLVILAFIAIASIISYFYPANTTATPTAVPAGGNNAQQVVAEVPPTAPAQTQPVAAPQPATTTDRNYINLSAGDQSRPNMLTWGGNLIPHSIEVRPDGSHVLRYFERK